MNRPLKLLLAEDNPADAELLLVTLRHAGFAPEWRRVDSEADYSAALAEGWDLILSDFQMPQFTGLRALELLKERALDIPFILVSSAIGEDMAVQAMKNGAVDYLFKDRLARLGQAVTQALESNRLSAERRRTEETLRASEQRFRTTLDSIMEGCQLIGFDWRYLYLNEAAALHNRRPNAELLGRTMTEVWPGIEASPAFDLLRRCMEERVALHEEIRFDFPDGKKGWFDVRCQPVAEGVFALSIDITRRKQLESQLLQAQKMEAVGQLAGGLAHDFNNVLTIVTGYARLLLDGGTMPPEAIKPLTNIFLAGTRATNLTRQLMVFSRKITLNRRAIDLNRVVQDMADLLRRLLGKQVKLDLVLSPTACTAEADEGMIEQVLMNLAVNARDAMSAGGTLTVGTELVCIDDPATRHQAAARSGSFICLSVRDTGCGIPPENIPCIFEPFFTTKDVGQGTGLGLAMVFGIVQQHQGWIELESAVGSGTCIRILIPAAGNVAAIVTDGTVKGPAAQGGLETILLVEDETDVREFAVAVLRGHGYRVLQAATGRDALEVWKWHNSRIALLVSDLVLPDGMGGVELAVVLRKENPALKVLLTSGYANERADAEFRPPQGAHFISKPYKPQALAQGVRDALDGRFNH